MNDFIIFPVYFRFVSLTETQGLNFYDLYLKCKLFFHLFWLFLRRHYYVTITIKNWKKKIFYRIEESLLLMFDFWSIFFDAQILFCFPLHERNTRSKLLFFSFFQMYLSPIWHSFTHTHTHTHSHTLTHTHTHSHTLTHTHTHTHSLNLSNTHRRWLQTPHTTPNRLWFLWGIFFPLFISSLLHAHQELKVLLWWSQW